MELAAKPATTGLVINAHVHDWNLPEASWRNVMQEQLAAEPATTGLVTNAHVNQWNLSEANGNKVSILHHANVLKTPFWIRVIQMEPDGTRKQPNLSGLKDDQSEGDDNFLEEQDETEVEVAESQVGLTDYEARYSPSSVTEAQQGLASGQPNGLPGQSIIFFQTRTRSII